MNYYVYRTFDLKYQKYYIGKRQCKCNIENDNYFGSNRHIQNIINYYKKHNLDITSRLTKEILHISHDEEENCLFEKLYIDKFNACESEQYYNIAKGGTGGDTMTYLPIERKQKIFKQISEKKRGKTLQPCSEERKEKISKALTGRRHSDEAKLKISMGGKGKLRSNDTKDKMHKKFSGEGNNFYGKHHSADYIKRLQQQTGDKNPNARHCKIIDKNGNILCSGIRQDILDYVKLHKICSESTAKNYLKTCKPMYLRYYSNKNAKDFEGIRFIYE